MSYHLLSLGEVSGTAPVECGHITRAFAGMAGMMVSGSPRVAGSVHEASGIIATSPEIPGESTNLPLIQRPKKLESI